MPGPHLSAGGPAAARELDRTRALLRDAGYTADGIQAVLGADLTALGRRAVPVMLRRASGDSPLEALLRLFMIGAGVDRRQARALLGRSTVERWLAWGLLACDGDVLRGTVQLACHGDVVLAIDWGPSTPSVGTPHDYVMGFSPSTLTLARMTVRQPSRATLDLGTGSGLQAMLAAAHSGRVVATDVNPRAVAMARFNAALNGLNRIECRRGDLFAAAGEERFDLVVSNPPFVVAPPDPHLFMSAGAPLDSVCASIVREAPRHLAPGGWCQLLANWAVVRGEDWRERLARWLDRGCDAWVIRRERQPADEYAALWIETETDDSAEYAARFDAWMRWYEDHDVEAVDYGLVSLRRRADDEVGRLRCDDLRGPWDAADGRDIAAAFARHEWLDTTNDASLLDARLRVDDAARLSREHLAVRGEWVPVAARLRVEPGLDEPGGIDPHGERIVAACDGTTPLRTLLQGMADTLGQPLAAVGPDALLAVRRLVERGILLPPD